MLGPLVWSRLGERAGRGQGFVPVARSLTAPPRRIPRASISCYAIAMLFMVIERFKNRDAAAVYRRFRERGRLAPEGLRYVGSWVEPSFDRCFQLMECDDAKLLDVWADAWRDLVDFEIVPVTTSQEAASQFAGEA